MNTYTITLALFYCLTIYACQKKVVSKNTEAPLENNQTYFIGQGTEPFWKLEISDHLIILQTPEDSITMPHTPPIVAMDANVKSYRSTSTTDEYLIQLNQSTCSNEMSGLTSPYTVNIDYKKLSGSDFKSLKGCGSYVTDYRLHDIWVLDVLNGKKITKTDFPNEFPTLEINSTSNSFLGFAGCNHMNGSIFYEKELLRFQNVATTKMMCNPPNQEFAFLNALRSTIHYQIGNNQLILTNPGNDTLIFKKID